jgi:hypothetical protein
MRKVRQLCKNVVGSNPTQDGQSLNDFVLKLATENALLRAEVKGHKMAADIEKKRRKRGKPLFGQADLVAHDGKSKFWSPTKISSAIAAKDARDQAKEDDTIWKAKEKSRKKQQKEEQARVVAQMKAAKSLAAKQKKQATEDAKSQKEVTRQLDSDLQQATPKPTKGTRASKGKKKVVVVVESDIEYEGLVEPRIWTPRPKRSREMPKRLYDYDLS